MKKTLSRLDVLFFLVCTLVGLDTLGSVAAKGAQGFLWLGFLAIAFFVPYALLVAELGSAFPQEGGPYLWARDALGKPIAAVVSVFYWFSNPIWLGGALTISAITTWNTFFFDLGDIGKYVFGLSLIWSCVGCAVLSLGVGKWVTTIGAWARVLLLAFFTLSVVLYGAEHGVHGVAVSGFRPTYEGFIGVVPLLFFNFVGFELPSAAGGEMVDPKRAVPFAVLRSACISVLCYSVPILAILLVVPAEHITGLKGFVDAMQTAAGGAHEGFRRAHAKGIKVYGATLTPYKGAHYFMPEGEAVREAYNAWIKTGGAFDGVVDFAAATADKANPLTFRADFNLKDKLHPNDAGYQAMADAFDLSLLK